MPQVKGLVFIKIQILSFSGGSPKKLCEDCNTEQRNIPNVGLHCICSLDMLKTNIGIAIKYQKQAEEAKLNQYNSPRSEVDVSAISTGGSPKKLCEHCSTEQRNIPNVGLHCICSLEMFKTNIEIAIKHQKPAEEANLNPSQYEAHELDLVEQCSNVLDGETSGVANTSLAENLDDESYDMSRKNRGFHIIFAQENFDDGCNRREGTEADVKNLEKAFKHLGFQNEIFKDLSVAEVKNELEKYSRMDHSANDCIAVTMLTHGSRNFLRARDNEFPVDLLSKPFEADQCRSLAGRPKIFIIQACRGEDSNPGPNCAGPNRGEDSNPGVEINGGGPNSVRIANHSDFIKGFSTYEGEVSYRHPQEGSIYIQALCKVILEDKERNLDFAALLVKANNETNSICNKPEYRYKGKKIIQSPVIASSLRFSLRFPEKNMSDPLVDETEEAII